ncbi:hypothetical protein H6P81_013957 [Aristolochia fimbriata]|uniref:Uncharacterized protein n=1 Tax=Aristolochia fimbriata TaxID=158543 RepID=A0AAV7EGL7_ARIFI|nr:hypothetical protein H6P81_013957 [Aristolochia fimbriata]
MKKTGMLMASMAAASVAAFSVSSSSSDFSGNIKVRSSQEENNSRDDRDHSSSRTSPSIEKFAPRFDGLRFIETLVTGHSSRLFPSIPHNWPPPHIPCPRGLIPLARKGVIFSRFENGCFRGAGGDGYETRSGALFS